MKGEPNLFHTNGTQISIILTYTHHTHACDYTYEILRYSFRKFFKVWILLVSQSSYQRKGPGIKVNTRWTAQRRLITKVKVAFTAPKHYRSTCSCYIWGFYGWDVGKWLVANGYWVRPLDSAVFNAPLWTTMESLAMCPVSFLMTKCARCCSCNCDDWTSTPK